MTFGQLALRQALRTIQQASRTVLREIGDLLSMLRVDDEAPAAPQHDLDHLDTLLDQFAASGLEVRRTVIGNPERVSGAVSHVAYRVIQEALTNAHKHGIEHRAHLLLDIAADEAEIVVTNPYTPATAIRAPNSDPPMGVRHGLLGLRERVTAVRGHIEAGPAPGGWRLTATIPIPTAERQ